MDLVLHDVVAYVEVRSNNDNRSAAICQQLRQLGAKIELSFTDEVTHVVFKEGMKRTWNKAVKRGLPLVSVHWLDSCKQNQKHMPEKDFPAILPDETGSYLSPLLKINQNTRWKKMKSMQPCDFDEEIARSTEREEKRKKRIMLVKQFKLTEEITPTSSSPFSILALETQKKSLLYFPMSGTSSPVPDTPSSMKERLEHMRKEQKLVLSTEDESFAATPKPPVDKLFQRRLFDKPGMDLVHTENSNVVDKISKAVTRIDSENGSHLLTVKKYYKTVVSSEELVKDISLRSMPYTTPVVDEVASFKPLRNEISHLFSNKRKNFGKAVECCGMTLSSDTSSDKLFADIKKQRPHKNKTPPCDENQKPCDDTTKKSTMGHQLHAPILTSPLLSLRDSNVSASSLNCFIAPTKLFSCHDDSDCLSSPFTANKIVHHDKHEINDVVQRSVTNHLCISPELLKYKFTKRKRNLFTDSTSLLQHPVEPTSKQENIHKIPASTSQTCGKISFEETSDTSFLFETFKPSNCKSNKRYKQRQIRQLSSLIVQPSKTAKSASSGQGAKHNHSRYKSKNYINNQNSSLEYSVNQQQRLSLDSLSTSALVMLDNDTRMVSSERNSECNIDKVYQMRISRKKNKKILKTPLALVSFEMKESNITVTDNSIDQQIRLKVMENKKREADILNQVINTKAKQKSNSSSSDQLPSKRRKATTFPSYTDESMMNISPAIQQAVPSCLCHARSLLLEQGVQNGSKKSYSLVMTSLHREEQEVVYCVVKQLGVFHLTNNVDSTSTHVVCGEPRRTLNVLKAIARGCWLLQKEWIFKSLEAGEWLMEEDYEITEFTAARKSRSDRQTVGADYQLDLFSIVGPIFVAKTSTSPQKELIHLINLCCGHVTNSELCAAVYVGDSYYPDKHVIKPTWILDCIMKLELLPTADYIVPAAVAYSRKKNSMEF